MWCDKVGWVTSRTPWSLHAQHSPSARVLTIMMRLQSDNALNTLGSGLIYFELARLLTLFQLNATFVPDISLFIDPCNSVKVTEATDAQC